MTTLRVIAEDAVVAGSAPDGLARYGAELARALVETAPPDCDVELVFAAHPPAVLAEYRARFLGAARVSALPLRRSALAAAWAAGVPLSAGPGFVHAPSLLAPLSPRDRGTPEAPRHGQLTATVHSTAAWTHPASLGAGRAAWIRRMAHRAARHADAIVVPSHAVADELAGLLPVGDRLRVIGGAVGRSLALPEDAEQRASWLRLPERFALAVGSRGPQRGIGALVDAMALPDSGGLHLLVVGDEGSGGARISTRAMESGLPEGRVRALGRVTDADLAVLLSRATVFVAPALVEGFGLSALEALAFGVPLIHSDAPALVELAGGAGRAVARTASGSSYAERLAAAVGEVAGDRLAAERLRVAGLDRAKAFSWRDSGARVWQLHAEL